MEVLKVESLSVNFGGVLALKDLSFSVEAGQCLSIIGPNGAGKTTLFNVLTGELPVATGKVYLFGQDVTNIPTPRRVHYGLSRSFQITALLPTLTTLENMLLAFHGTKPSRFQMLRSIIAYSDIVAKAKALLEKMDLWEKRGLPVNTLSYGDQRKIEIALGLASNAKILLLDEPTSGLTKTESNNLIHVISSLTRDITILLTAHDMDIVFGLADEIMVLSFGEKIAHGTPEEIQCNQRVNEIYLGTEENGLNAEVG